ncbi:MAG: hypothetical protein ACRD0H_29595, partial [Actinomycetes bacterium]
LWPPHLPLVSRRQRMSPSLTLSDACQRNSPTVRHPTDLSPADRQPVDRVFRITGGGLWALLTFLWASQRRVNQGRLADGVDLGRAARNAVELANAAYEVARSTSPAVRALAVSGLAKAQAAVGNAHGFHAAAD